MSFIIAKTFYLRLGPIFNNFLSRAQGIILVMRLCAILESRGLEGVAVGEGAVGGGGGVGLEPGVEGVAEEGVAGGEGPGFELVE